ncbi:MAG: HNH endonuclease [Rhodobacteraceae bacterium]|nr:HNH endonuclease [Paracoccaceae bacterium]
MTNWANRTLYHGDNLPILRAMNSESVDLIATDPPFNKGRDFHATPDSLAAGAKFQDRWSWEQDVHQSWIDQLTDDWPRLTGAIESVRTTHSDSMGAYICFMAVRLLEMHRILKDTGSIYLHCDPTASHYLKAVMDAIFGWKQFMNELIWCYPPKGRAPRFGFHKKHDVIFYYRKTLEGKFNHQYTSLNDYQIAKFSKKDEDGRSYKEFKGRRTYLDQSPGRPVPSWWADIGQAAQSKKEFTGYPTQKPIVLLERIIKASSDESDMVLDPFCGCATTLVAAENLQRQWVGIDIWKGAHEMVRKRMADATGFFGKVTFTDIPPVRTDDGEASAPFLRVKQRVKEPEGPRWTRAQMYAHLLDQHGHRCMGCNRAFDDPRYLELDHNTPRSDGGLNHISNRVLLCGPCNKLKSNTYTLSGLQRENRRRGYMQ